MENKINVIVNADDYGLMEVIDRGIIDGIKKRRVSSVSVMMNFPHSKESLKTLIRILVEEKLLDEVGVGIHLNISTGSPLSGDKNLIKSIIDENDNFYDIKKIKGRYKKFSPYEIQHELVEQIENFIEVAEELEIPLKIDHFNSQHNLLQSIDTFADLLVWLSGRYQFYGKYPNSPIPIRRPMPMMMEYHNNKEIGKIIKKVRSETRTYLLNDGIHLNCLC